MLIWRRWNLELELELGSVADLCARWMRIGIDFNGAERDECYFRWPFKGAEILSDT